MSHAATMGTKANMAQLPQPGVILRNAVYVASNCLSYVCLITGSH